MAEVRICLLQEDCNTMMLCLALGCRVDTEVLRGPLGSNTANSLGFERSYGECVQTSQHHFLFVELVFCSFTALTTPIAPPVSVSLRRVGYKLHIKYQLAIGVICLLVDWLIG